MPKHSTNQKLTESSLHAITPSVSSARSAGNQETPRAAESSDATDTAFESLSDEVHPHAIADAIPGSSPDGHVIVGADIRLREGSSLQCDGVDMADTEDIEAALKLSRKAFEAAKSKIATRTQVSSSVLRVMAGIQGDCMKLSVVIDQRHVSNELMEEFEILGTELTTSLRSALTCAGATLTQEGANSGDSLPGPLTAPHDGPTDEATDPKSSPERPLLTIVTPTPGATSDGVDANDTVAKRFCEGLLAIKRPGSLIVSLVANGKPDEKGSMTLQNQRASEIPVRRRDSTAQEMTGFVHTFNRSGKCEFKKEGATARVDAEFPTDDAVAMLLRLACDNPAVTIEYHPYRDMSDGVVCIQITKLIGLSAPWAGVTGAFANLALAVETLRKLVPKGRKRE